MEPQSSLAPLMAIPAYFLVLLLLVLLLPRLARASCERCKRRSSVCASGDVSTISVQALEMQACDATAVDEALPEGSVQGSEQLADFTALNEAAKEAMASHKATTVVGAGGSCGVPRTRSDALLSKTP